MVTPGPRAVADAAQAAVASAASRSAFLESRRETGRSSAQVFPAADGGLKGPASSRARRRKEIGRDHVVFRPRYLAVIRDDDISTCDPAVVRLPHMIDGDEPTVRRVVDGRFCESALWSCGPTNGQRPKIVQRHLGRHGRREACVRRRLSALILIVEEGSRYSYGVVSGHSLGARRGGLGEAAKQSDEGDRGPATSHAASAARPSATAWHATCPPPAGRNAGSSLGQRSKASGQRGWKVQPEGGSIGFGISPAIGSRAT